MKSRLCRTGDAGPKGKGAFAARPIPASTRIAAYRGEPRWIWDIPEELWPYAFQVDYDRYVVPRKDSVGWFLNHSCDPNCLVAGLSIVTGRGIAKGEELTFDYSSDVDWPGFTMKCRCGARTCRGTVKAYRFLPGKLKRSYGRHVAAFIARRYGVAEGVGRTR